MKHGFITHYTGKINTSGNERTLYSPVAKNSRQLEYLYTKRVILETFQYEHLMNDLGLELAFGSVSLV